MCVRACGVCCRCEINLNVCVPVLCVVDVRSVLMCVCASVVCCRCEINLNVCAPVVCVVDVRSISMCVRQWCVL